MVAPCRCSGMESRIIALVLAALVGAGCLGGETRPAEMVDGASESADASAQAAPPSPTSATATENEATGDAQDDDIAPVPKELPFAFEGATGTFVYACAQGQCAGESVAPSESLWKLPLEGDVDGVDVTLTWDAATPATETLHVAVAWGTACGGDCIAVTDGISSEGTSPLTLTADDLLRQDIEIAYLMVSWPTPQLPGAWLGVDQPFTVEGKVRTYVVAPEGAA